ncbi:MAG: DUF2344 domain-containing protein [Chloroflexota bacterium]|nr:MAG: DUF2344 domain-containing protein [Chloroflexota bacterium]
MSMRIRANFAKTEHMRFTSHLDLYRAWERLLRRTGLPVSFSQGYNPRPRLQLAAPLPLGITSQCEIIDFWLASVPNTSRTINSLLQEAQPPGIDVQDAYEVEDNSPTLQKHVIAAEYIAELHEKIHDFPAKIDSLLNSKSIIRQRREKSYDLRPLILDLKRTPLEGPGLDGLFMRLDAREGSTGRPEEVLLSLNIQPEEASIQRIKLIIKE